MISQKQNNFHWPEVETPPSPYQKQTAPAASSWRGWSLWLRILGAVVALVGPFTWALLFLTVFQSLGLQVLQDLLAVPILLVVGIVSAGLIRSWWSLLIVPVMFCLGLILCVFLTRGLTGGFDTLLSIASDADMLFVFFVGMVPVVLSAAVGTPIGKGIERRKRLRQLSAAVGTPIGKGIERQKRLRH